MKPLFTKNEQYWKDPIEIESKKFKCGFCNSTISPSKGYPIIQSTNQVGGIFICPYCDRPNFISPSEEQTPAPPLGESVENVPDQVSDLYEEARRCTTRNCFTAAVLACRKILMHVAVERGANEMHCFSNRVRKSRF